MRDDQLEVLLVHPGGPLWARRDAGAWSIPKGEYADGEDPFAAAMREFEEELGTRPPIPPPTPGPPRPPAPLAREPSDLGEIRQKGGKRVRAWAMAGDLDTNAVTSNTCEVEWPPRSGKRITIPEVDRAEWFGLDEARQKINPAQVQLLDRLEQLVGSTAG
jgi:predicted NUDIX family NTP pyrophosphohydrolase